MPPITNQQIFDLLQAVKADVRAIREDFDIYRGKVEELEVKVTELETENTVLQERIKYLEESAKKNQVIVFGLQEDTEELLEEKILNLLTNTLAIEIHLETIDNLYRIGKKGKGSVRPVIIRFVRFLEKQVVLKNAHKLRGTGISICNDLTLQQQKDHKILYKYYKTAKDKGFSAKITGNRLVVNEETFNVKDLREVDEVAFCDFFINKKHIFRNNSAPATPESRTKADSEKTLSPVPTIDRTTPIKNSDIEERQKNQQIRTNQTPTITRIVTRTATGRTNSTSGSGRGAEKGKNKN